MKKILLALFSLTVVFISCDKDPDPEPENTIGTLRVNFVARYNGQPFVMNQNYTNISGYTVKTEMVKFLMHRFVVTNSSGTKNEVREAALINFANGTNSFEVPLEAGSYTGIQFGLGVDSTLNKQDPSLLPASHPFSLNQANDMHWSWSTGYIFFKLEGKADTTTAQAGPVDLAYVFHPGSNALFRKVDFPSKSFSISAGSTTNVDITLDVARLFYNMSDTIDLQYDNLTHTSNNLPLATRFMDICADAFSAN